MIEIIRVATFFLLVYLICFARHIHKDITAIQARLDLLDENGLVKEEVMQSLREMWGKHGRKI